MSFIFAVTVLVVNLVLWVLLLARFRSLFDTGDIVDKTKDEITELTRELNRVAQRDIGLFNECSKQLHTMLDEADKKVLSLQDEAQKASTAEASIQSVNEKLKAAREEFLQMPVGVAREITSPRGGSKKRAVNSYKKTAPKKQSAERGADVLVRDTLAVEHEVPQAENTNEAGSAGAAQQPLFDERAQSININVPALQVENDYADKNIGARIYLSDAPQEDNTNTDVPAQVMAMARSGFEPEQIAEKLQCSLTEVQMILDMSLVSGGR